MDDQVNSETTKPDPIVVYEHDVCSRCLYSSARWGFRKEELISFRLCSLVDMAVDPGRTACSLFKKT